MPSTLQNVTMWARYDGMSDVRTKGYFLVDSPIDVAITLGCYFGAVYYGPKIMKQRKPFQLKGLIIGYNLCLVILNAYVFKEIFLGTWRRNYAYLCCPSQQVLHADEMRIVNAMWLFYVSKVIEFVDTIFFILKKKNSQLSVLHIYHHSTMFPLSWIAIKWYPSGSYTRLPMLNSFVHVIMYSYYGLSAMGSNIRKYLWWKKYLTLLQLVQFFASLLWALYSLQAGCNHPIWISLANVIYMGTFLFLFGKFYLQNYSKSKTK